MSHPGNDNLSVHLNLLCMSFNIRFLSLISTKARKLTLIFTESIPLAYKNFSGLLQIFKNVKGHIKLMNVLKPFRKFPVIKTRTSFIYLFDYTSRNLLRKERLAVLTYHYGFLQKLFPPINLKKIFGDGIECWSEFAGGEKLSIRMVHSRYLEFEGSLSLLFFVNGSCIYTLSFTVIPGSYCSVLDEKVILMSLLQGKIGEMAAISRVTKSLNDLIPSTILMSVIEGIALSVGIKKIIGISVKNQLSTEIITDSHYSNYNAYWTSQGGVVMEDGNYLFPCPLQSKPIELIKAKYRSRTIAKRAKRLEIAAKSFMAMSNYIRKEYVQPVIKNGMSENGVRPAAVEMSSLYG
jgi:uncharacterized protein VirK/YbjX